MHFQEPAASIRIKAYDPLTGIRMGQQRQMRLWIKFLKINVAKGDPTASVRALPALLLPAGYLAKSPVGPVIQAVERNIQLQSVLCDKGASLIETALPELSKPLLDSIPKQVKIFMYAYFLCGNAPPSSPVSDRRATGCSARSGHF